MKVYLIGEFREMGLECSYASALIEEGAIINSFNYPAALSKYIRFGKLGHIINQFVPVEQWIQKLNKEIAVDIKKFSPDLVLVFTNAPIQPGTIAFVKSLVPAKFILVWPDTLCNLGTYPLLSSRLYDAVASHGQQILPVMREMGFLNPFWLPFAADKQLHLFKQPPAHYDYDISFVGSWSKERENVLAAVFKAMPHRRLAIFGPGWDRAKQSGLSGKAVNRPLRGHDYASVFNRSFINLNVISEIAYPSANMRFFEIPVAYGLQMVNDSPEQATIFKDGEHIIYFNSDETMLQKIDFYLTHPEKAMEIRKASHELVCAQHTYRDRMKHLLKQVQEII